MTSRIHTPIKCVLYALILLSIALTKNAAAQQSKPDAATVDKADVIVYRIMFRRVSTFKKEADDSKAAGKDSEYKRFLVGRALKLDDVNIERLEKAAMDCETELAPLHLQVLQVIAKFRSRFPEGHVHAGADLTPPAELKSLQEQEDEVVLRHRDQLRFSMTEPEFQSMHMLVHQSFSGRRSLSHAITPEEERESGVMR